MPASLFGTVIGVIIFVFFWVMIIKKIRASLSKGKPPLTLKPEKKNRLAGPMAILKRYQENKKKNKMV